MDLINFSANTDIREFQREFTYNNTLVLTLSATYLEVNLPNNRIAQNRINNRIRMQISEFYHYVSDTLYPQAIEGYNYSQINGFPFNAYDAVLNYQVTFNQNGYFSLYRDQYEFTGGAHGNTIRRSDTWELTNGDTLPLAYFFEPGVNYQQLLIREILIQSEENMRQNPGIYFDDYPNLIVENFNPESYFLTPSGIAIYYQQYEIAPYSTGIVVFTIPYNIIF